VDNSLSAKTLSQLLAQWYQGDDQGLRAALLFVHEELRRLAHHSVRRERRDHTLPSTARLHVAYIWLEKQGAAPFKDRTHFLAICAQWMRQILIDYARAHGAATRHSGYKLTLDDRVPFKGRSPDLIARDDALTELAKLDPQQSRIVGLRFFASLPIEGAANLLGISPTTAKRHCATASIRLHHQLSKGNA